MQFKKFKVEFKEQWARAFATELGELNGNVLEIVKEVWSAIIANPKSHLASRWRLLNTYAEVKEIKEV